MNVRTPTNVGTACPNRPGPPANDAKIAAPSVAKNLFMNFPLLAQSDVSKQYTSLPFPFGAPSSLTGVLANAHLGTPCPPHPRQIRSMRLGFSLSRSTKGGDTPITQHLGDESISGAVGGHTVLR